ncbi:unnamed protein product [Clavelina lepadiformis]|uniref:GT23 domain-containing protein n=1 Tax=Clavelina lepadiformis TaxID=159417 RepID=A0ABP0FT95_CLALP
MEKKVLLLLLAFSFGLNAVILYNFMILKTRPTRIGCKSPYLTKIRDAGEEMRASSLKEINANQYNGQFTLRVRRNLIKNAYSEALQVKEFVRKYFRKDLDQTTKTSLEEDYYRNFLPFDDLVQKLTFLFDDIYRKSRNDLTILGDQVQRRIHKLQNPSDCKTAKRLICKFPSCGFGCQFHHLGNCLFFALGTNRVMQIDYKSVKYQGFEKIFLPPSETCSNEDLPMDAVELEEDLNQNYDNISVVTLNLKLNPPSAFKAHAIPHILQEKLKLLHDNPNLWWIGQIIGYLFRPRPWMVDKVQQITKNLNLTHPYVSIHVRRTDKLTKERKYEVEEYMEHVADWFDRRVKSANNYTRKVFVASDDIASVIPDARTKYPDFEFLYHGVDNIKLLKDMTQTVKSRQTEEELVSLVCNLMILSQSDHFVGTYSSNIGSLATQLMHSLGDATFKSRSIDYRLFYFRGLPLTYRAIEDFFGERGDLSFSTGEKIVLDPKKECPLYKGFGRNEAGHRVSFPMHKVEEIFTFVQYPALNDIF